MRLHEALKKRNFEAARMYIEAGDSITDLDDVHGSLFNMAFRDLDVFGRTARMTFLMDMVIEYNLPTILSEVDRDPVNLNSESTLSEFLRDYALNRFGIEMEPNSYRSFEELLADLKNQIELNTLNALQDVTESVIFSDKQDKDNFSQRPFGLIKDFTFN